MARILIFSFDTGMDDTYVNVYRDSADPTYISNSRPIPYDMGQPHYPTYSDFDEVGSPICTGTTETRYLFQSSLPYANYTQIINSPTCGYVPSLCDIALSTITHTDETNTGANDGTVNAFFTSSHLPIHYYLVGSGQDNLTGFFTGVAPGTYEVFGQDDIGCQLRGLFVTIQAFDSGKTRCKYRLRFSDIKSGTPYELRFLYQKSQFDPLVYPLDLTGTDSPVIRKTTNTEEDKTAAFAPSSLAINVIYDTVFEADEFADAEERDWKVELYKKQSGVFSPRSFSTSLTEATLPSFIDGNVQVKQDAITKYTLNSTGSDTANLSVGSAYSIEAFVDTTPIGANAKIRMTITRGATVVYDKQIPAIAGASMIKTGIVQDASYNISVVTVFTTTPVTTIDIPDNDDPTMKLDWQGWLLPDQLQDFYADAKYAISMIAGDGLLSLKGGTFADQSLFYLTPDGIKRYVQLFGLKKWIYLVKICLDQLGYDYGNCTILSSLCYVDYKGSLLWTNLSTWSDLFYDQNNEPKSTYDALEILLRGVHLQIYQEKGSFVMVDNNDLYWRNTADLTPYCFLTDLDTFVNNSAALPEVQPIGANQINKPTNPKQTLNKDNAFNRIRGNVDFNLLSLLYPNPSFELNAVQGDVPYLLTADAGISAYADYQPQDPLNPNVGAYSGDWVMRTVGYTLLLKDGGVPVFQDTTQFFFSRDSRKEVYIDVPIDQPNKKINLEFKWRPVKYSDTENVIPRFSIFYTDNNTGNTYLYSVNSKGGFNAWEDTGWYIPEHPNGFAQVRETVTDYLQWNSYSISTDRLPDTGIGHVFVGIGTPLRFGSTIDDPTNRTIDYDGFVITQSDANDAYNFQKGETHTVTNITTYAKSEKKDIDLELYTYPNNKRAAGNVSYGDVYLTSAITNEWYFALSIEQVADRLPANIIRRIAKNYQRPMYKFQGDIITSVANYYSVWVLRGYESMPFMPFTIEHDLRNAIANVVLIEIDDIQMQSIYQYLIVYEKSARNNIS